MKKIKKFVNDQNLAEDPKYENENNVWPPLQKYTKEKRVSKNIFENAQISEIMHPGSEEWVRLVTGRLF